MLDAMHVSVRRTNLRYGSTLSTAPSFVRQKTNSVTDVLYLPSFLDANEANPLDTALDDEHFTSLLCDKGYSVHTLIPRSMQDTTLALHEMVKLLSTDDNGKHSKARIGLIGCELSCCQLLSYISESGFQAQNEGVGFGAIVLIDPPPLFPLLSKTGRSSILLRYFPSLANCSEKIIEDLIDRMDDENASKRKKKRLSRQSGRASSIQSGITKIQQRIRYLLAKGFSKDDLRNLLFLQRKWQGEVTNDGFHKIQQVWQDLKFWGHDDSDNPAINHSVSSNLIQSAIDIDEDNTQKFVPKYPTNMSQIAEAIENRIKVMTTNIMTTSSFPSIFEAKDTWGYEAAKEIAVYLRAGEVFHAEYPVMSFGNEHMEDLNEHNSSKDVEARGSIQNLDHQVFISRNLALAIKISNWFQDL